MVQPDVRQPVEALHVDVGLVVLDIEGGLERVHYKMPEAAMRASESGNHHRSRGQLGDLRHRAGMARDHDEPTVDTLEVGQPHAELITRTVAGGVVHGELWLVLLERFADADRGAAADHHRSDGVAGHDQRRHGAQDDDQQVAPSGGAGSCQKYADRRRGERGKGDNGRIERWPRHFRKAGQLYGHRRRLGQQQANGRLAEDREDCNARCSPDPDGVVSRRRRYAAATATKTIIRDA